MISLEHCILLGHSFGGYVAYELARILRGAGSTVAISPFIGCCGTPRRFIRQALFLDRAGLDQSDGSELKGKPGRLRRETPEVSAGDGNDYEKALEALKSVNRVPHSLSVNQFRQYIEMIAKRAAAFAKYKPAPLIETNIYLYRALEIDEKQGFMNDDGGWAAFTGGSFKLQWVPGNHFTMIKGEQAAELVQKIHGDILNP